MRAGWILRVGIDRFRNRYRVLIKTLDGEDIVKYVDYHPRIYLSGEESDLKRFVKGLDNYLVDYGYEEWYKPPWYRKLKRILWIELYGPNEYREVIKWLKEDGRYVLWNTYPEDKAQMMYRKKLSASTLIDVDNMKLLEDPWRLEYDMPKFRRVRLRILDWYGDVLHPFKYPPKFYEADYIEWNEVRRYASFDRLIEDLRSYNPDIFEFYNTAAYHWFKSRSSIFRRWDRVYIDYGWNVLEPDEYYGYVELSRLSRIDIHDVSRYSIGKILTTIESYYALELKRLIPDVRTDKEGFKTLDKLSTVDRGGYIHVPRPGLYWNVAQCDFTSLYPSIIVKYNIGNETVNYRRCREYIVAPESRHRICMDIPSTVAYTLDKILSRRVILKDLARKTGDPVIDARQTALKWILVTCFGYLGYRNARFGKIEAYECVTSYARHIMYKAIEIAREMGFKVIHTLVDSIWISREDAEERDYLEYCDEVYRETGFRMELDTIYRWLYIPEAREGGSVINRYLGGLVNGGFKAKGISLVRRDTPEIIKEIQKEVLTILSNAKNEEEFKNMLEKAYEIIEKYKLDIREGRVNPFKLVITKKVEKPIHSYISKQPHIKAASKLGLKMPYRVKYIATPDGYIPVERWRESHSYNPKYYLELIDRALRELPLNIKLINKN